MKRKWVKALVLFAVLAFCLYFWPAGKRDVRYTIKDLGTLGGNTSIAYAINNQGHIAGNSVTANGPMHAFLWTPEKGMRNLGSFFPTDMNDHDDVVGMPFSNQSKICLWTPAQGLTYLGPAVRRNASSLGINNRGEIAGSMVFSDGIPSSGFIWNATDGFAKLDPGWLAHDISDSGKILCTTGTNKSTPFLFDWTSGEVSPSPGLTGSVRYTHADPAKRKTREGGEIRSCIPFSNLKEEFPLTAENGFEITVNDSNGIQTVGTIRYVSPRLEEAIAMAQTGGSIVHRFLYTVLNRMSSANWRLSYHKVFLLEGGVRFDLDDCIPFGSGWDTLVAAQSINDSGQIAGVGLIGGDRHALLLTPMGKPVRRVQ